MLGYGGEDFIIVNVVYPCVLVNISSLGYFLSVGSSSKTYHHSLPVSVGARHIKRS